MYRLKEISLLFTLLTSIQLVSAQDVAVRKFNLQELFALADSNNRYLQILSNKESIAEAAIIEAKQQALPQIDATLLLSYNGDGYITDRHFANGFSVPIPDFGNNLVLQAEQVIYAGGAVKTTVEMARANAEMNKYDRISQRQAIRFDIASYYLELLKLENQRAVLVKNISQTEKLIAQLKAKHNEGVVLRNSVTRYELQLQSLHVSLLQLDNTSIIINNELVELLDLSQGTKLQLKSDIDTQLSVLESHNVWSQEVYSGSADLKKSRLSVTQAQQSERLIRTERLPQVFAYAGNYLNGPITIEIPVLNNNFNYWNIGIGVKYNLSSLFKNRAKETQAQLKLRNAVDADVLLKNELLKATNAAEIRFRETRDIYATHLKGVELAEQNYTIIRNRFLNDMALTTEMLDAENTKLDAELQAVNSKINILFHYYQLKKLAGTL